jgi:hypothetical protein
MRTDDASPKREVPPGHDDFGGEILVANGKPPRWFTKVPYVAMVWALGYYVLVRATDPVNLVFAALLVIWFVYTPIAQKKGWFFIPM